MRHPVRAFCLLAASSAAFALATAAVARAAEEIEVPPEVLEDEWLVVQIGGEPAGRGRTLVRRKGDRILTNSKVVISISRLGVAVKVSVSQSFLETVDGVPIRLKMVMDASAQRMEVTGRLVDGKLELTSDMMGRKRTKTIDWPDDVLVGYAMERHVRERTRRLRGELGAKFSFRTFSLEHDGFLEITYEVAGEEEIDCLGERVRATKFKVTGLAPGVVSAEYRDAEGIVWKIESGVFGLDLQLLRATKEVAEEKAKRPASIDAIGEIAVDLDHRIARQFEVDSARYRLHLKDGRAEDLSLEGPRQEIDRVAADGSVILRVESVKVDPDSTPAFPLDEVIVRREKLADFLRPTTYLQSDDAALARKAREIVQGHADNAYEAAKLLERWVFENVTAKGFDRGFASAKEVFQDRAGDCTEHAVLLAAMLRAVGIPSRVATGVTYMELRPGRPQMFYHMWTEGWLGRWVPLDATLAGEFVDSCHIRLASSDMSEMSPEAGSLEILQAIGRLRVEVLEYTVNGRSVVPARDAGP